MLLLSMDEHCKQARQAGGRRRGAAPTRDAPGVINSGAARVNPRVCHKERNLEEERRA